MPEYAGMPTPTPSPVEDLADDLKRVSYYGVGHAMGDLTDEDIPDLADVARRLAPDPRQRLRVSIALCVRDAVLRLDPPKIMQAAAALLWLDLESDDFEDDTSRVRKPLKERHPAVAALLGKGLASYERRKEWRPLYEKVAANLLAELNDRQTGTEVTQPLEPPALDPNADQVAATDLVALAAAGADLHYAALTSLFVAHFHNECVRDPGIRGTRQFDWENASEQLFTAYCRYSRAVSILTYPDWRQSDPIPDYFALLGESVVRELELIYCYVQHCGPLEYEGDAVRYGNLLAYNLRDRNLHNTDKVISDLWTPWYRTLFTSSRNRGVWPPDTNEAIPESLVRPRPIDLLAVLGERVAATLAEHFEPAAPASRDARKRAQRLIYTYYDVDDWLPLGNGWSLRDRVAHFFEQEDRRIVKTRLTCYNGRDGFERLAEQCKALEVARMTQTPRERSEARSSAKT
jgi:hypothetical protein